MLKIYFKVKYNIEILKKREKKGLFPFLGGDGWIDSPLSVGILMRVLWTVMYLIVPIEMLKISFFIPEK